MPLVGSRRGVKGVTHDSAEGPTVSAVVLTRNQKDKTLEFLSNLAAIKRPQFNVVLWDNGSTDGTLEVVRRAFPEILAHYHPVNLGVATGRNRAAQLAIEAFDPTHLLFLDNDIHFEPDFVSALLEPFAEDDRLGQTQAKLRFMHDRDRLNDGGGCRINFVTGSTTPVGFGEVDEGQHDERRECIACGGAMMVRVDVFLELGGFDPSFDPFGPEDLDFSLRLSRAGYYALYVPQAVGYHAVSHTYGQGYTEDYARYKSKHWFLLLRRHGTLGQQIGFFLIGAPYLALKVVFREGVRGNLPALRGLLRGVLDLFTSPLN